MRVKIKRIDKSLPLPVYETQGAVGFDLLARTDVTIHPKGIELIPANVIVQVLHPFLPEPPNQQGRFKEVCQLPYARLDALAAAAPGQSRGGQHSRR